MNENYKYYDMILNNFIFSELNNETFSIIYSFISMKNFIYGKYEGNQYTIKKINQNEIEIVDHVSEEFCNDHHKTRVNISVNELISLLKKNSTNIL